MNLSNDIETLSQRIESLTAALNAKNKQDALFWFGMKADMVAELVRINHELDKVLIDRLK